jgi:Nuclease-related domain
MRTLSYPRVQQYRRLARALGLGALSLVMVVVAVGAAAAGMATVALVMVAVGATLAIRARRWAALGRRSRIGAVSEQLVRKRLTPLERDGWTVKHSLRWPGGGDVDHVATAPLGITFAIETKTRSYRWADVQRIRRVAGWLSRRRAPWRPRRVIPVLCLAGERGVERFEAGVAVVSLDRLLPLLCVMAGARPPRLWW